MDVSEYEDVLGGDFTSYEDYGSRETVDRDLPQHLLVFLKLIFALVIRAGFILIQIGSIPVRNVYDILFHNVIELAVATISFCSVGIGILWGLQMTIGENATWTETIEDHAAIGLMAVIIGTAEISAFLAGRIHIAGSILVTILYSAILQPLLIFAIWSKNGWLAKEEVIDHGGALTIHLPSTIFGLTGSLFLGRRLLRVRDVDEFSFSNENAVGTIVGYLLVIVGFMTCSLPLSYDPEKDKDKSMKEAEEEEEEVDVSLALINNLLALATGIALVTLFYMIAYRDATKYWRIIRLLQGGIAGMMIISPGVGEYSQIWQMYVLPIVSSIFFFFSALLLHNTALEDACNMTSSHLICGFLGILLSPLFIREINLYRFVLPLAVIACSVLFALLIFFILMMSGILRSKYEVVHHKWALNVQSNRPKKAYLQRLLMIDDMQTPHIIPGSYRERFIPRYEHKAVVAKTRSKRTKYKKDVRKPENVEYITEYPELLYPPAPAISTVPHSSFEPYT